MLLRSYLELLLCYAPISRYCLIWLHIASLSILLSHLAPSWDLAAAALACCCDDDDGFDSGLAPRICRCCILRVLCAIDRS